MENPSGLFRMAVICESLYNYNNKGNVYTYSGCTTEVVHLLPDLVHLVHRESERYLVLSGIDEYL